MDSEGVKPDEGDRCMEVDWEDTLKDKGDGRDQLRQMLRSYSKPPLKPGINLSIHSKIPDQKNTKRQNCREILDVWKR